MTRYTVKAVVSASTTNLTLTTSQEMEAQLDRPGVNNTTQRFFVLEEPCLYLVRLSALGALIFHSGVSE